MWCLDLCSWKRSDQTDEVTVVEDIAPHATHHFLALPRTHITSLGQLSSAETELVAELGRQGRSALEERLGAAEVEESQLLLGFHLPPMISIQHLHLHILYPISSFSFLTRWLIFNPSLPTFATFDRALKRLENKK